MANQQPSHNGTGEETVRSENGAPAAGQAVRDYFSTDEIFQRVAASADEEFDRPTRLLLFSGLAAGLSIGLSFYARAAVTAQVDSAVVGNLLYPIGFLLIVIGRYQLFTENTLTPVTLVITRIASLPMLLRNWGLVLSANVAGAALLALFFALTPVMSPDTYDAAVDIGHHALAADWDALFVKGIMAGWLVASMVWLVHAARDTISRIVLVFFIMYLVPTADLYHCIIGICEALFMFYIGETTFTHAIFGFFTPVVLGNTVGGVLLVALLNYAQTRDSRFPDRDCDTLELTWREWLFEFHAGRPELNEMTKDDKRIAANLIVPRRAIDHVDGERNAPITIVQYGDYECPDSRSVHQLVRRLRSRSEVEIAYIFRHLPLGQHHPHAVTAAIAAEAAGKQGAFWDMHERLFRNQDMLKDEDLFHHAETLELDMQQFKSDFHGSAVRDRVERDRHDAIENKIFTSLNLFINGKRHMGDFSLDELQGEIRQLTLDAIDR